MIQRSDDGGSTWEPVGNKFAYDGVPGTHQWYDGTPHPREFERVRHLEPSLDDPDAVYAGVEDAGLLRSTDGGHGSVWTSTDSTAGRSRTIGAQVSPASGGGVDLAAGGAEVHALAQTNLGPARAVCPCPGFSGVCRALPRVH